jgi:type VI secretion system secreted protein VgrG
MLISADDQPNANGQQLEMASSKVFFSKHCSRPKLGRRGQGSEAATADYDRQKALLNESLSQLKKAGILISAPAGMALASRTDLQCTAAENLIHGGRPRGFQHRKTLHAGRGRAGYFMFAQKLGIKAGRARHVELQAQSDEMRLLAIST